MKISNYANSVAPSLARALFNMAKEYDDVADLTLGDPDFSAPASVQEAACKAIREGKTHYSANAGLIEARRAVKKHIEENWNISPDAEREILVSVGGMEALFLTLAAMIDPGDEVIIFAPYYVNYVQMVSLLGGVPKIIDAYDSENGFYLNKEMLEAAVTEKTVAILVNSPNNPTGAVLSGKTLKEIAEVADRNDLVVVSDEVYRTLLFDGAKHDSILHYMKNKENAVLIDSLSKEFCMTGWRVGYAYGSEKLISNMTKMQENVAACAPLPSQYALIEAYTNPQDNSGVLKEFQARRDFLFEKIRKIEKLKCIKPQGTFYLFADISQTGLGSLEFAEGLLKSEHIAVVPGITYGENYSGYIRIAFTKDISVLKRAVEGLKRFVSKL